jgi:hypothetical protein
MESFGLGIEAGHGCADVVGRGAQETEATLEVETEARRRRGQDGGPRSCSELRTRRWTRRSVGGCRGARPGRARGAAHRLNRADAGEGRAAGVDEGDVLGWDDGDGASGRGAVGVSRIGGTVGEGIT